MNEPTGLGAFKQGHQAATSQVSFLLESYDTSSTFAELFELTAPVAAPSKIEPETADSSDSEEIAADETQSQRSEPDSAPPVTNKDERAEPTPVELEFADNIDQIDTSQDDPEQANEQPESLVEPDDVLSEQDAQIDDSIHPENHTTENLVAPTLEENLASGPTTTLATNNIADQVTKTEARKSDSSSAQNIETRIVPQSKPSVDQENQTLETVDEIKLPADSEGLSDEEEQPDRRRSKKKKTDNANHLNQRDSIRPRRPIDVGLTPTSVAEAPETQVLKPQDIPAIVTPTAAASASAADAVQQVAPLQANSRVPQQTESRLQPPSTSLEVKDIKTKPAISPTNSSKNSKLDVVDRARLIQRVSRAFQQLGNDGGSVRIRLHPPRLGSVGIEVEISGNKLSARIVTETDAAKTAVRDNIPDLRDRLAEQGFHIDQIDVVASDGAGQGRFDNQKHPPSNQSTDRQRRDNNSQGTTEIEATDSLRQRATVSDSELDVLV